MTDHFQNIYTNHANDYERLIAREDYQGNIWRALQELAQWSNAQVVEFGAGTGRLTRLLVRKVSKIQAFDAAPAMLAVAENILKHMAERNWSLAEADNRNLPVEDDWANIAIEGWSFAHLHGWYPDTWQTELEASLNEMQRVLKPDGTAILMETLGTGYEEPTPPNEGLAEFYETLEQKHGFTRVAIRTDYQFESLAEALELSQFFFGDELAQQVKENKWIILPECTGIWWRKY